MKAFVLGTADDVRGFALAGVEGSVCARPEELEQAAAAVKARADLALVLVSPEVARLLPQAMALLSGEQGPPAVVVLP